MNIRYKALKDEQVNSPPHIIVILYCKWGLLCKCKVGLTSEQDSVDTTHFINRREMKKMGPH